MEKNRIEAFSDGVFAIIITVMVLDLKVPVHAEISALKPVLPVFLTYVLSFIYLGIYWNNHHHLLKAARKVSGGMMWANLHLLFWLSIFPFVTGWMGENHFTPAPTAIYGAVMLLAALAYYLLQTLILSQHDGDSKLARAIGKDWKGKLSPVCYMAGIAMAFLQPWISCVIYSGVALIWLIPDRRIEKVVKELED
ncbi:MAG: TMEM175 family protein [Limisphaerales bacterium]